MSSALAEFTIEITQGVDNPTRIAISPITLGGKALPEDISKIVSADLDRSGLFSSIPRQNMLSFPARESDVYFRDWRILGTEYLVVGDVAQQAGSYKVTFSLMEVAGGRKLFTKAVDGQAAQLRDMAHYISDQIYETITGIPGAFSTRIAYVSAVPQNGKMSFRLMVSDADGARERLLLESKQPIMSPAWSPDARELVYVSFETGRPAIFRQNLATAAREQLTNFRGLNGAPAWSPDGRKLALVLSKDGNPEIYTLDLTTRQFTRVTTHFAIDTEPNWMPDGKSLVFTSDRGGAPQIYKLIIASGQVERLTFAGSYNARPRLAPDGRTLVMVHRNNGDFHIASQDLVTGDLRVLTQTYLDESPTVAPNGAMLIYATKQGSKGVLAAVSLDQGVKFLLPATVGDVREPAWSPK
ncbi:Tol-Pal system beta propeller repeat protein TolB [Porticoccus sp.]|uniref:Tol-Pal system beta propeller repeat protein TolB n=1 Tax=Porticoccus sp. TaxID=2024853 RepID=UPI003F695B1F